MYSPLEDRSFLFESVLDVDFAEWFYAIRNNIEVRTDGSITGSDLERMCAISEVGMKMIISLQESESQKKREECFYIASLISSLMIWINTTLLYSRNSERKPFNVA